MSATVHLDEEFAREAAAELVEDRLTALGPALGVDLVGLARHARLARRRGDARDALLVGLFAVLAGCVVLAWHGVTEGRPELLGRSLLGLGGTCAAAWALVLTFEHRGRTLALEVIEADTPAATLAPPLGEALEERLREQERANVIPYWAGAEREHPFVGSGVSLRERVWQPIDVGTPAADPSGDGTLEIVPFDVVELHAFVVEQMGSIAGLGGLRAGERLYVLGTRVGYADAALLPDRLGRPRAVVPPEMVRAALAAPGSGMRTYVCLERAGEGGRVIVSMHLRARLQHPSLTWEVAAYVVPPLDFRFDRVRALRLDAFGRWLTLITSTTRRFLPDLCTSPLRLLRKGRAVLAHRWGLWHARWLIGRQHLEYDYGATGSLRARVGSWSRMGFSDNTDTLDYLQRLQQGVLTATERFLKDHNVDTTSFEQAKQVINHHSYTFHGPINGPGNYGSHGTIDLAGPGAGREPGKGQGPAGPGGPAPAPARP
ncbi:hypothetical protein [Streptomyces sp. NPDC048606]|uniref:hypothetical protein n=1 Tax=Streptomyces sp. NPDC048606 TaxID=3154726 RepID=UPI00342029DA